MLLIVRPEIPQMPHSLSAQFVSPRPKVLDFNEIRLHWASVVHVLKCSWHVFTNSESTNPQIFFTNFFLFSFKTRYNFSIEIKNVAKTVYFHKKDTFQLLQKKTRHFSWKKSVDSEFAKICHIYCHSYLIDS